MAIFSGNIILCLDLREVGDNNGKKFLCQELFRIKMINKIDHKSREQFYS